MRPTRGPWAYARDDDPKNPAHVTTVARVGSFVVGLASPYPGGNYRDGDPDGDEEADAALIASVHDLLRACELVEMATRGGDYDAAFKAVRAALARAKT